MNREIKFRVWNAAGVGMRMYGDEEAKRILYNNASNTELFHNKGAVIMQYTGLKDKNGVEIYEGDIVLRTGYSPQEIWFEDGTFLIGIKDQSDHHFYKQLAETIEVIGNIYEHPELLTTTL